MARIRGGTSTDCAQLRRIPMNVDLLGYLAAVFTTSAFAPQAFKTIRTRDTSGISFYMYLIFTIGTALWIGYGLAVTAWPIIIANSITLLLAATILVLKIRHG
jgi:MtN3 and saliva related transmembrane protein